MYGEAALDTAAAVWPGHQLAAAGAAWCSDKCSSFVCLCRLWSLAWPLSWMEVLTFTKELIITAYVGRLGALELSALVLSQTLYNVTGNAP